jgi:hypothetical protein
MAIYALGGLVPGIHPDAFVNPDARSELLTSP